MVAGLQTPQLLKAATAGIVVLKTRLFRRHSMGTLLARLCPLSSFVSFEKRRKPGAFKMSAWDSASLPLPRIYIVVIARPPRKTGASNPSGQEFAFGHVGL